MRPLTEDETRSVFEKLHKFIGKNIKSLIDRPDQPHCLRLQRNRVFYVREDLMRRATNVRRGGSRRWPRCLPAPLRRHGRQASLVHCPPAPMSLLPARAAR